MLIDSAPPLSLPMKAPEDAQRLLHGRGHCFPGWEPINIDWLPPVILITLYQEIEPHRLQQLITDIQHQLPDCQAIVAQYRFLPRAPCEWLAGQPRPQLMVQEAGLRYQINLGQNQNHGLFLDIAPARQWVQQQAAGKHILNLFSYTCAFSVAALAGGAASVINIDKSKGALRRGRDNHRLNQHSLDAVTFSGIDIFKSWGRIQRQGPYHLVICDPPLYQRGSVDIQRDYPKIIRRLPQLLHPDGKALLCLNSPHSGPEFILDLMKQHCPDFSLQQQLAPPAVFCDQYPQRALKMMIFSRHGRP